MNKIKYLLLLAFLLLLTFSFSKAQDRKVIQLSGTITNDSLKPLSFANVYVRGMRRGTTSNFQGRYTIAVREKDTVIFSTVGYEKVYIIIPDTIKREDYWKDIHLPFALYILDESIVYSWSNYEQFKREVAASRVEYGDYAIAVENIKKIVDYEKRYSHPMSPEANFRNFMQQVYDRNYTKGQYPVMNLFNPFAWAKYIQALKNGEYKDKKIIKDKEDDD